jgi:hypothetical protein
VEGGRKNAQANLQIEFEESRFSIERVSFEFTLIVIVQELSTVARGRARSENTLNSGLHVRLGFLSRPSQI